MKSRLFYPVLVVVLAALAATPIAASPLHAAALRDLVAGPCTPGGTYDSACDVNHDGAVNVLDVQLTAGHWNQTGVYSASAAPPCFDNANRYVDCGNGSVTDTVTGLIWLKNANCFGLQTYAAANNTAAGLQTGGCGLTDNSSAGDWRLPTRTEWEETVAWAVSFGCTGVFAPSLTDISGSTCYFFGPQQFTGVQINDYWSTATATDNPSSAWAVYLYDGTMRRAVKTSTNRVWPVRGGQ